MKTYKLNTKYLICLIALLLILILVGRVAWSWLNDGITMEDGTDPGIGLDVAMSIALVISLSWLWSAIVMFRQLVTHRCSAFTVTEEGIENTLTFVILFAFIFVLPVKKIPWDAITYADDEDCYIRARRKDIEVGFLAKTIVAVKGYSFCHSFIKPKMTREEFEKYVLPKVPKRVPDMKL